MSQAMLVQPAPKMDPKIVENIILNGDLSGLSPEERVVYYRGVCESLGVSWLSKPFDLIKLNGKLTLYAKKDCTDQLSRNHKLSREVVSTKIDGGCYIVVARAKSPDGRFEDATGIVWIEGLKGEAKANAMLKAECVPLEYEILTKEGFKHALELEKGELVAAMDHQTQTVHWVPLEEISIFENQTVAKFGNSAFEFEITKGHKWVTETLNGVRGLKPFDEIKVGTSLVLAGVNESEESLLTPKEAATLGWIVTDGTIKTYKNQLYRASICQSKRENFEHIEWAVSDLKFSRGVTEYREDGWLDQHWWYISKKDTQTLFNKAGFTTLADLPGIAAQLGYSARKSMLEAMMRADGDKRNNFGKTKPEIISTFQILCALNGFLISKLKIRNFENSTKPFLSQRKFSYQKVNVQNLEEQESRITTVWCPTTKYGTWICRADTGQVFVTGNTKAKRRAVLSIQGLGFSDESEVESIPGAQKMDIEFPPQQQPILPKIGSMKDAATSVPSPALSDSRKPSEAQLKRLFAIAHQCQVKHEQVKFYILKEFKKESSKDLSLREYDQLCDDLKAGYVDQVEIPPLSEEALAQLEALDEAPTSPQQQGAPSLPELPLEEKPIQWFKDRPR